MPDEKTQRTYVDESVVPPEKWASDGADVIAGVEDVDQDPDLFARDEVSETFVEPKGRDV